MKIFLRPSATIFLFSLCLTLQASQDLANGTVKGTVMEASRHLLVRNARVTFTPKVGVPISVLTDDNGEFTASLPCVREYSVSVEANGFWPMHRPEFRPRPRRPLKFDFLLSVKANVDTEGIGSPGEALGFTEDTFNLGRAHLVVASGRRNLMTLGTTGYHSVPTENGRFPVTISFGTYTVKADTANLDQTGMVLTAEGDVVVESGSGAQAERFACVEIRPTESEPKILPCRQGFW